MWRPVKRFWRDERGTLLITEWVFLATILVIAIMPLAAKRFSAVQIESSSLVATNHPTP
jgi:hypothetical protein